MGKKIRLKKDIVIPAGTVFDNIDGMEVEYASGNYGHTLGLTENSSGSLVYGLDPFDPALEAWFEEC